MAARLSPGAKRLRTLLHTFVGPALPAPDSLDADAIAEAMGTTGAEIRRQLRDLRAHEAQQQQRAREAQRHLSPAWRDAAWREFYELHHPEGLCADPLGCPDVCQEKAWPSGSYATPKRVA
jgi:hypothetical protein